MWGLLQGTQTQRDARAAHWAAPARCETSATTRINLGTYKLKVHAWSLPVLVH